jgi:hypothetical protein
MDLPTTGSASGPARRYTVGFAPNPGTLGWLAGSHWLGRCAALLQPLEQLAIEGVDAGHLHRLTAEPRRQGWHAPFVPSFMLAQQADWMALHQTLGAVARSLTPTALPPLQVETVGNVLALVLPASHPANTALADAAAVCARQLLSLAEEAPGAPQPSGATAPFRFHMPITGPLHLVDTSTRSHVLEAARDYFSDLPALRLDSLALFAETAPGADFALLDHLEMDA